MNKMHIYFTSSNITKKKALDFQNFLFKQKVIEKY